MNNSSYHHKNLKEELIRNGIRIFNEDGFDKFSMRKVAKACGVSQAAPYRHFKNKESFLFAIIAHIYHKFDEVLKNAIHSYPNDANSQLREMTYLYIKFFTENPECLKFMFFSDVKKKIEAIKGNSELFDNMEQPYKTFIGAVERYKEKGDKNKVGKPVDTNAFVLASWGLAHGIAMLIAQNHFLYSGDYLELVKSIIWSDLFVK